MHMETLYEDNKLIVERNSSNEIFITSKKSYKNKDKVSIRVSEIGFALKLTAHGCNFHPTSFNGLSGFIIDKY